MIDPQEFGAMQARVKALETSFSTLDGKVDKVLDVLAEFRGGKRMLMYVIGGLGAVVGWLATHFNVFGLFR